MAGSGNTQIIQGKTYTQYTPEWYAAMKANEVSTAGTAGTAAGTEAANAITAETPALQGLLGGAGGAGGAGGLGGGASAPGTAAGGAVGGAPGSTGLPASLGAIAPVDPTAANNAAFASAKDKVGATGRASLQALNDELGANGMIGSGAQVAGTRDIINTATGALGEEANQEAIKQSDVANTDALANQSNATTQRGQNIQSQEANAQLELSRQIQQQNATLALLKTITGSLAPATPSPAAGTTLY